MKVLFRWIVLSGCGLGLLGSLSRSANPGSSSEALAPLIGVLKQTNDTELQRDILQGMYEALQGRRNVPVPHEWSAVYRRLSASADSGVREKVLLLSLLFGDPEALAALRQAARDSSRPESERQRALQALIEKHTNDLFPLLRELLSDPIMRRPALRGLAACGETTVPELILEHFRSFNDAEKADAIGTLASRPAFAQALLDALEKGTLARKDVSAYTARQLVALRDPQVAARLNKLWGSIRPADQDRLRLLAHYKKIASAQDLANANRRHGREVFAKTCASCHTLFDAGARIGPDLTGSQRRNPEYVLSKVLDPNAVVARDYQMTVLVLADGRTLSGIVKQETRQTLSLQTQTDLVRVAKTDIEERKQTNVSMMPEGLLAPMSETDVRDLLAYLGGPDQVALPQTTPGNKPPASR